MRLVIVKIQPQFSKGKYKGGSSGIDSDGLLRIATNLLDVPAEIRSFGVGRSNFKIGRGRGVIIGSRLTGQF